LISPFISIIYKYKVLRFLSLSLSIAIPRVQWRVLSFKMFSGILEGVDDFNCGKSDYHQQHDTNRASQSLLQNKVSLVCLGSKFLRSRSTETCGKESWMHHK
jgi:hypothetical protein